MKPDDEKPEYIADANEMIGKGYEHRFKDETNDHKYFIITPRVVKAYCRNPYDFSLWDTIRDVAGEKGECYLSTPDLAALSGMSSGQVSNSRKYLLEVKLLTGTLKRDPGYPQPVWHLSVPDLWAWNIKWCEEHPKIAQRIDFKKSLQVVKPSGGEKGITPGEKGITPGETKKNHKQTEKRDQGASLDFSTMTPKQARDVPTLKLYIEAAGYFPGDMTWEYVHETITKHALTVEKIRAAATAWAVADFKRGNVKGILEWAINGVPEKFRLEAAPKQEPVNTAYQKYVPEERDYVPRPKHLVPNIPKH